MMARPPRGVSPHGASSRRVTAPPATGDEPNAALPLELPTARRVALLAGRVLRLKCPNCGGGPVRTHWFRMRVRCGNCGIAIERGEGDYFIGSMMLNLLLSELVFAIAFVSTLLVLWPDVPWDVLQYAAPAAMIAAPFALFPISKLAWLAFDLGLRPERRDDPPAA